MIENKKNKATNETNPYEKERDLATGLPEDKSNGKTFTQEEVNAIIAKRLAKVKSQPTAEQVDVETQQPASNEENDLTVRTQSLQDRELLVTAKEQLLDRGMPLELAGMIKFQDETDLSSKLDILQNLIGKAKEETKESDNNGFYFGAPEQEEYEQKKINPVRRAMGL